MEGDNSGGGAIKSCLKSSKAPWGGTFAFSDSILSQFHRQKDNLADLHRRAIPALIFLIFR